MTPARPHPLPSPIPVSQGLPGSASEASRDETPWMQPSPAPACLEAAPRFPLGTAGARSGRRGRRKWLELCEGLAGLGDTQGVTVPGDLAPEGHSDLRVIAEKLRPQDLNSAGAGC